MPNQKTRQGGKKKGPTRKKPRSGKAQVLAEYKAFKGMFRKWADAIKLDWNGKPPFSPGAQYRFILPNEMVNFVVSLVKRSHTKHEPETLETSEREDEAKRIIEENARLREAIQAGAFDRAEEPPPDLDAPGCGAGPEEPHRNDRGVLDKRTFRCDPEEIV